MKVQTSNLIDCALNWAVAKALGCELTTAHQHYRAVAKFMNQSEGEIAAVLARIPEMHCAINSVGTPEPIPSYSTSVGLGSSVIFNKRIHMCPIKLEDRDAWQCWVDGVEDRFRSLHVEPLVAAMRALVHKFLGDTVDVPDDLVANTVVA